MAASSWKSVAPWSMLALNMYAIDWNKEMIKFATQFKTTEKTLSTDTKKDLHIGFRPLVFQLTLEYILKHTVRST